ncbi:unnamed protein product [Paramecium octaurelia]|uniref:Uncharacterized protein n=1 Tax=Paramecium octaurelia TaxID=43137 RepID=A0A8S1XGI8_PAROT|nr:unnamed protein product [Paramecium octaurelia]
MDYFISNKLKNICESRKIQIVEASCDIQKNFYLVDLFQAYKRQKMKRELFSTQQVLKTRIISIILEASFWKHYQMMFQVRHQQEGFLRLQKQIQIVFS